MDDEDDNNNNIVVLVWVFFDCGVPSKMKVGKVTSSLFVGMLWT